MIGLLLEASLTILLSHRIIVATKPTIGGWARNSLTADDCKHRFIDHLFANRIKFCSAFCYLALQLLWESGKRANKGFYLLSQIEWSYVWSHAILLSGNFASLVCWLQFLSAQNSLIFIHLGDTSWIKNPRILLIPRFWYRFLILIYIMQQKLFIHYVIHTIPFWTFIYELTARRKRKHTDYVAYT